MNELRVTAAYFIKESDMTKAAKLQLMNFLENEATDAQVMALLLDGKVQVLDEMAESIVYDRWDASVLEGAAAEFMKGFRTVRRAKTSAGKAAKIEVLKSTAYSLIKRYNIPIVIGGPHPSLFQERTLESCNAFILTILL